MDCLQELFEQVSGCSNTRAPRAGEYPQRHLADYVGIMQADAFVTFGENDAEQLGALGIARLIQQAAFLSLPMLSSLSLLAEDDRMIAGQAGCREPPGQ